MIAIVEAVNKTSIPNFVPAGVLWYAQDTGDVWIGTGSSEPPNVLLIQAGGSATPGGTNGEIQYNEAGVLGGSGLTTDAIGDLTVPGFLSIEGILYDSTSTQGAPGQVLSSTGTGVQWVAASTGGGSGFTYTVITKTSNYSANSGDDVYASGTFNVTLPVLSAVQRVKVRNKGTGVITVLPTSGTINGAASMTIARQYSSAEFSGDGVNIGIE